MEHPKSSGPAGPHDTTTHHPHHIVPLKVYYRVFAGLIALTIITVATSYIDFGGSNNILVAMVIATAKALMVILFFMGLKYEGQENNVTFFSSLVFLSIFVGLTSADLFYRTDPDPAPVEQLEVAGEPVDVKQFQKPTPELIAQGKALYAQNCVSCHGVDGKGDGPAAAALNPKPRNFHTAEGWTRGRTLVDLFVTVTKGIEGTPMPGFSALSAEQRFALAHYVYSLTPNPPEASAGAWDQLAKEFGGPAKPKLSIDEAMELMSEEWERKHGRSR